MLVRTTVRITVFNNFTLSLAIKERALSSVGSEHLVYTQGVRGSNPLAPTLIKEIE